MKIDFSEINEVKLENFNGGEKYVQARMYRDDQIKIMRGTVIPGASIGLHTHGTSLEVVFLTKGEAVAICDGKEEVIKAGTAHYCPNGANHTMINRSSEPFEFFAVVPEVK